MAYVDHRAVIMQALRRCMDLQGAAAAFNAVEREGLMLVKPMGKHEAADAIFMWLGVNRDHLPKDAVHVLQEIAGSIVAGVQG